MKVGGPVENRIPAAMILLISLLVFISGCSSLKGPTRTVKFEILKGADMPAGAKVKVIIEGDQSFLMDAPGSKEITLKAETKREVKVTISRLTPQEGPSIYLDNLRSLLKVYVDGKEADLVKAPGAQEFYISFVMEKAGN
jgi:hypothetical protein